MKIFQKKIEYSENKNGFNLDRRTTIDLPDIWKLAKIVLGDCKIYVNADKSACLSILSQFNSDGSTLVGDTENTIVPAFVHDALYKVLRNSSLNWLTKYRLRKSADAIYLGLMLLEGEKPWRASFRYRGLRLFGWRAAR